MRRNAPAVDFTQSSSMVGLKGDLLLLRLYGHWDRAFPAAQHVASVPWMNWGQFEVLRMIVHDVRWAAAREGDLDSVAKLGEHAFDDDYRPLFMEKEGLPFKRPLDDPKLRRSLGLDPSPGSFILPPPNRITPFLNDLSLLAMIWAYGGSPVWPMDRLEHERARLEAGLLGLPGMS
ncbi:hypothetical protein AX769_01095 [Frondihabitans sp. PAMC 28766]|nr:hypothetical protein AX769_01095 [Frondihabitans sp. PAMC 28766]